MSLQTRNRGSLATWKAKVRTAAMVVAAGAAPSAADVEFIVTHYYDAGGPDVDNIIKPLQDALVGIVYVDDNQVQRTSSRRRSLNDSYRIRQADAAVLQGFAAGKDFVHIAVKAYVDPKDLTA